jgi:CDP-2,3-bis-(O-geranylgeranyl)-sn-glycerol synthase
LTADRLLALFALLAPAYAANLAPPFVRYWRGWNRPLHRRLLGEHKTVVGTALGLVAAFLVAGVESSFGAPALVAGERAWWLHGLLCGVGALGGDAAKSWLKRRRGIAPGGRWVPFDQLDFQVGALVAAGPGAGLTALDVSMVLALGFLGDLAVNRIAWWLGIKPTPW